MLSTIVLQSGPGGFGSLFGILMLLLLVGLVIWTYSDAQANSSQPAILWAVVVLIAPLLGFILYVILGRNR